MPLGASIGTGATAIKDVVKDLPEPHGTWLLRHWQRPHPPTFPTTSIAVPPLPASRWCRPAAQEHSPSEISRSAASPSSRTPTATPRRAQPPTCLRIHLRPARHLHANHRGRRIGNPAHARRQGKCPQLVAPARHSASARRPPSPPPRSRVCSPACRRPARSPSTPPETSTSPIAPRARCWSTPRPPPPVPLRSASAKGLTAPTGVAVDRHRQRLHRRQRQRHRGSQRTERPQPGGAGHAQDRARHPHQASRRRHRRRLHRGP